MRIIALLELALLVSAGILLAKPALGNNPTKAQFNSDTLSTSLPRYLRQGNRSYLALVCCELAEIRLKGTRSEGTQLSLNVLNTNLPGVLPKPLVINARFWSSGPALMTKGQYYLIILTANQNQTLEAYPFGFIDFSINQQAYRLTDYFEVSGKAGQPVYAKTLQALNQALASENRPVTQAQPQPAADLRTAFARITPGMPAAAVLQALGKPDQIYNGTWYYSEHRPPRAGENLPVYMLEIRAEKVISKQILPGADATGPAPDLKK